MSLRKKLLRYLPILVGALITAALTYLIVMMMSVEDDSVSHKQVVQQITVFAPPPPPPPPPPPEVAPEEQPPEEESVVDETDEAMPEEGVDEDVGSDLGMDAEGGAGSDGFGLVGRKGGRGIIGGGYGALVVQEINSMLVDDERLRGREYTVILQLWINTRGHIERYKIDKSNADSEVLAMLDAAIIRLGSVSSGPPLELPQPIRLRIKSRF